MTLAYFDCFAGAAGDMIVGALLDAGVEMDALAGELDKLGVGGYTLGAERVQRGAITATWFRVHVDQSSPPSRHFTDIRDIIRQADLIGRAGARAEAVLARLAAAEAHIHGIDVEHIHFHEVGAIDSIVDIVAACAAMELLGAASVVCSPVPSGRGTVQCDHGVLPVPSPATARLLAEANVPLSGLQIEGEAITPTAAAVLTTLAESFGPLPAMTLTSVGYGAGSRNEGPLPNVLRVFVGQADSDGEADTVVELSANLDDCTGELIGATIERLLAAGCVDAWASPVTTKKSRPGWILSALCAPADASAVETIILSETTSFGVRRRVCARTKLLRHHETVQTRFGPIGIKIGSRGSAVVTASPEFEDCRAAAEAHHASIKDVLAAAQLAYGRAAYDDACD